MLDNASTTRPMVFNDLTGKETLEPRLNITMTLAFLHETYLAIKAADAPKVEPLATRLTVTAICYHMGWLPIEVSVAEQYVAQTGLDAILPVD